MGNPVNSRRSCVTAKLRSRAEKQIVPRGLWRAKIVVIKLPNNGASMWHLQLEIRTALFIATFMSLIPALIGVLVWRTRRTCPGFGRWTLGNLLGALCLIFLSLRGTAPDWISIVLANACALGAAILFFQGIRLFQGLRLCWWPECLVAALAIGAVIYFRYVTDNIGVRIVAISAVLGSFGLCCGFKLLKRGPAGRTSGMVLTGLVFTFFSAGNFLRMYYYASGPAHDLFVPAGPNAALFVAAGLGLVGWMFGFLLMVDERVTPPGMGEPHGIARIEVEDAPQTALLPKTVTEAEVRQQVQRIIESDVFRRSARMEQFLMVTVDRALRGHPEELKEYLLGRDVFNRGENYDPRTDAIVRVEAQRLRRKLREYYEFYGGNDPIIVECHPGSYVPSFRYKESHRRNGIS